MVVIGFKKIKLNFDGNFIIRFIIKDASSKNVKKYYIEGYFRYLTRAKIKILMIHYFYLYV